MPRDGRSLLLLSNSRNHGSGYLDHAEAEIRSLFVGIDRILFVPFALQDQFGYWNSARERFEALGIGVDRLIEDAEGRRALRDAQGVFVGGGNTFRLLDRLQRSDLLTLLRDRALDGMPYLGSSAGTVITAPTLGTTNDMPIVEPSSFRALGLVPYQINCHYLDADPGSRHMGETRELRIREFLEENEGPVLALREGAYLRIEGERSRLGGTAGAVLFRRGADPLALAQGDRLSDLDSR